MSELEHSRSTVGTTDDDWLSQQMGTDVCVFCRERKTPAEIEACEQRGPGRVGCGK